LEDVHALPADSRLRIATPDLAAPIPPPVPDALKPASTDNSSTNHAQPRGFFKRLGGFFAALFH